MFTDFTELHKAYGFYRTGKTREDLSEKEERALVNDCFDTYEYIGFAGTFGTPYTGAKLLVGKKFAVLGRVKELCECKNDDFGAVLECLPMWKIRFEDGFEMAA